MNFRESESYLLSLGNEVSTMKLGLDNMRKLLTALENPQNNSFKVQVAGTNGKGSVCAFLDSICNMAGIKTGTFTSPHLVSITERIRINGCDITEAAFARNATRVRETAEQLLASGKLGYHPTFFEQVTAIALVAFSDAGVELVILETGLGGRLDATTAANAEIGAITAIDYDHQEYLGATIEEIATEKAAIIHEGSQVVVSEQTAVANKIVLDRCARLAINARSTAAVRTTCGSGWLKFETENAAYEIKQLGLAGGHQVENAKAAILLAETLQADFPITADNIVEGVQNARHTGRLEYSGNFLLDGAHNPGGAKALAAFLNEFEKRPITLVFGATRGKNVAAMVGMLFALADRIVLTEPDNSRALTCEELLEILPVEISRENIFVTDSVSGAIDIAKTVTRDDGIILVTGSLYLIGDVKRILAKG